MDSLLDHTADIGVSAEAPYSEVAANYTAGIPGSDGPVIQPSCPWCRQPVEERSARDGRFHGMTYVQRTYRCEPCGLTLYANQDPRPIGT